MTRQELCTCTQGEWAVMISLCKAANMFVVEMCYYTKTLRKKHVCKLDEWFWLKFCNYEWIEYIYGFIESYNTLGWKGLL